MKKYKAFLHLLFFIFLCIVQSIHAQKPLKILFMLYNFPTLSATFVMGQITGLIDKGHSVYIFAQEKSLEEKIHPDIERYNLLERTYYRYLPEDVLSFDILYCQFFLLGKRLLPEIIALKKKAQKTPKFVVCCRGSDGIENVDAHKKTCQQLFQCADAFFPVCEHFKNLLLQAGCNPEKITVHHSAIDLTTFRYKKRTCSFNQEITLLSIGRLVETKGLEYSIHAFAKLAQKFSQLRYIIVGDGPQRKKLEQLILDYGLTKKISLLGWCSRDEVVSLLNKSHIFIHPSVTSSGNCQEGIPNVLMEAMATGLPVLSTYHGGIPELVHDGASGFLVPERSIKDLVEKIGYLIKNIHIWPSFGAAGKNLVNQKHNIKTLNDRLESLFLHFIIK